MEKEKSGFVLSKSSRGGFCIYIKSGIFCSVEKEERKEEPQEEKETKIRRRNAVAAAVVGMKRAKKKKPEAEEEDDNDYRPPSHLARLKPKDKDGGSVRGRQGRRRKKEEDRAFSPNMDFYYYSGFGPLWCKKRGQSGENSVRIIVPPSSPSSASAASEHHDDDERRRDEEDDVDVGDYEWEMEVRKVRENRGGGGGRRKKVKARSLKTLL